MQILELTFTVDHRGRLKIPAPILTKMGLAAGDHVRVAYLTHDGSSNTFCELMLLSDGVDEARLGRDDVIHIPAELMHQAKIPQDADLQIACLDGCIIIIRDTGVQPEELNAILEQLQAAESFASMLPGDVPQALSELERTIQSIEKGSGENE